MDDDKKQQKSSREVYFSVLPDKYEPLVTMVTVLCVQVRLASDAAGVCVRARRVQPRARRPSSAARLPHRALPGWSLQQHHQRQQLLPRSIPESPRWLLLRRRMDVLERYRSNSPRDQRCLDQLLDSACSDLKKAQKEEPVAGHAHSDIITHLRHPTVLLRLIIMSYLSVASALTYFGICMNIGSFGVGIYSAQFFSGLSETPCLLIPLVRLGRRPISMLTLFLSGAACFLSLLLSRCNSEPVLVMSLALMGKLCILATTSISILYCIELFPTVVRQRCVSLVNLSFRLGSLVNTLVPPSPNGTISLAAMVVYSGGPIIGCGLCLLLPETSGVPLPDSVEDCDRQPRPRPPSLDALWWTRKVLSSRTTKPEILPVEKDALKQLTGLI